MKIYNFKYCSTKFQKPNLITEIFVNGKHLAAICYYEKF